MRSGDLESVRHERQIKIVAWSCVAIAACLLAAILYAALTIPGLGTEPATLVKVAQSAPAPDSHLRIVIAAPADNQPAGASGALHLLLENSGAGAGDFSLSPLADKGCVKLGAGESTTHIDAYQTARLTLPLDTSACQCQHLPHAEVQQLAYSWKADVPADEKNQIPRHSATYAGELSIGPVTVSSPAAEFVQRLGNVADLLIKNFTWPLALAVLGYLVQYTMARRAERQQIFSALLPSYTELVQTHYMPIVRRMGTVGAEAERVGPTAKDSLPPAQAFPRIFAAILLMRRRFLHLLSSKGAVFFRSAVAEELFDHCISQFYVAFRNATGGPNLCEELVLGLEPEDTLTTTLSHLFSFTMASDTNLVFPGFEKWTSGAAPAAANLTAEFQGYLALLGLGQAVLNFECDRIFYQSDTDGGRRRWNWYFDPPQFEFEGKLEGVTEPKPDDLCELLTSYLNEIPAECRRNTGYPRVENGVVVVKKGRP